MPSITIWKVKFNISIVLETLQLFISEPQNGPQGGINNRKTNYQKSSPKMKFLNGLQKCILNKIEP